MRSNRHVAILFMSFDFVLIQFVVELVFVSFLINISPEIGTLIYRQKTVFVIVHILITVILLWYAGKCGDAYCIKHKK